MQSLFALSMAATGFLMVGFSPVSDYIAAMYGISPFWVQLQTLIFLVAFVPGNFIVIMVLGKYGLRTCVRTSIFKVFFRLCLVQA